MGDFVGRMQELVQLADLKRKKTSSLITMRGRRRIGKSTLIRHFSVTEKLPCFEFQGLPPQAGQSNRDQLDEFAGVLSRYLASPKNKFTDWTQAFASMNLLCLKNAENLPISLVAILLILLSRRLFAASQNLRAPSLRPR